MKILVYFFKAVDSVFIKSLEKLESASWWNTAIMPMLW